MAIICKSHGLLFIMSPRTGCTAVGEVLRRELGGEFLPTENLLGPDGRIVVQRKHSTLQQLLHFGLLSAEDARQLYKVTAVRNPFDSLVSLYIKQRISYQPLLTDPESWVHKVGGYAASMRFAREHTFEEWVLRSFNDPGWGGWRQLLRRLSPRRAPWQGATDAFTSGVDFVMRFEDLQADFGKVLAAIGVERRILIPRVNETAERASGEYRSYYTNRARRAVTDHFRATLDRFGYSF